MCLIFKILLYDSTPISSIFEQIIKHFLPFFGHFDIKEKENFWKKEKGFIKI